MTFFFNDSEVFSQILLPLHIRKHCRKYQNQFSAKIRHQSTTLRISLFYAQKLFSAPFLTFDTIDIYRNSFFVHRSFLRFTILLMILLFLEMAFSMHFSCFLLFIWLLMALFTIESVFSMHESCFLLLA